MVTEGMSQNQFDSLSDDEKKRLGAIPERRELFETKIVEIAGNDESEDKILVSMRDPGNASSLLPVIKELISAGKKVQVLADGRGLERLMKEGYETRDLVGEEGPLLGVNALKTDLILTTNTFSEKGLEHTLLAAKEAPVVLVENMYEDIETLIQNATRGADEEEKERVLNHIAKVCVMDEWSKTHLLANYPALEGKVEVTGQPFYDRIYTEDREGMRSRVREALGIAEDEKFIIFFGSSSADVVPRVPNAKVALLEMVESLKASRDKIKFVFTNHPRDIVSEAEYQEMISVLGGKALSIKEVKKFDSDSLQVAADVIVSPSSSTIVYDGIYRRKVVIALTKDRGDYDVPAITTGSVIELTDATRFNEMVTNIIENPHSIRETMANQERSFPLDGNNTHRVVEVVKGVLS